MMYYVLKTGHKPGALMTVNQNLLFTNDATLLENYQNRKNFCVGKNWYLTLYTLIGDIFLSSY